MDEDHLKLVYESWVRDQIDSWIGEYGAWDYLIEDGDITDEELDHIRKNLYVSKIEISKVEEK